jgi:hypothetical protein
MSTSRFICRRLVVSTIITSFLSFTFLSSEILMAQARSGASSKQAAGAGAGATVERLESRTLLAGDGLSAIYFNNSNFTGTSVTRVDGTVNFAWSTGAPASGIAADTFSVRWAGEVQINAGGTYSFRTTTDDGVRLWVDDKLLIDSWTSTGTRTLTSAGITLQAGRRYHIVMEYYDNTGGATAQLLWQAPGSGSFVTVPQSQLHSNQRDFPADSGYVNVKTHGAVGDGIADDTAAIQAALDAGTYQRPLYFPNGTYRISGTLQAGTQYGYRILQGQNRDNVVIKLNDSAAGFQDPAAASPMITFFKSGVSDDGNLFRNSIYDMTFDAGKDNPGAHGVRYVSNNQGAIRNVTIRSQPSSDGVRRGVNGLDLSPSWPGPSLYKNMLVEGFNTGIHINHYQYGNTFEYINLQDQNTRAVYNFNNAIQFRRLNSRNDVPFYIDGGGEAHVVVIDSTISNPTSTGSAFTFKGEGLIRDVALTGYAKAVDNLQTGMADVTDTGVLAGEYSNGGRQNAGFASNAAKGLRLAIEETPEPDYDAPANWIKVDGTLSDDDTQTIRNAIAAANSQGKKTIYFPGGQTYKISGTIDITGGIQRIIGMESHLQVMSPLRGSGNPVFRFTNLTSNAVIFERFGQQHVSHTDAWTWFENNTAKTVVFKSLSLGQDNTYFHKPGAGGTGKVFFEDITGKSSIFANGQKVWGRQFNHEAVLRTNIVNDGATLWLLGFKSENEQTNIETKNNGTTELLGGLIYPARNVPVDRPSFIINNSRASLTYRENGSSTQRFAIEVRETRGTETRDYTQNPYGTMPLFIGYADQTALKAGEAATVRGGTYGDTNYGSASTLEAKNVTDASYDREIYLKFNLSGVSAIGSGILRLFGQQSGTTSSVPMDLLGVSGASWSESTLTWNNRPAPTTATLATTNTIGSTARWYEWDITSFLQAEKSAGRNVVTLVLRMPTNSQSQMIFNSDEAASDQPELALT